MLTIKELRDTLPDTLNPGLLFKDGFYCTIGWGLHLTGVSDQQMENGALYYEAPDFVGRVSALRRFASAFHVNFDEALDLLIVSDNGNRDRVLDTLNRLIDKYESD